MSLDMTRPITAESLLDTLANDAGDPRNRLDRLQQWAQEQCAKTPTQPKVEKSKKSGKKAA
jgi:hypothetical protein